MLTKKFKIKNSKLKTNHGFTLPEIMVTMTIMVILIFISSDYITSSFRSSVFNEEQATAIHNARRAVNIINKEVRGANSSELGDYPLANANDDDFSFYSDIDDDGEMEKIRYYYDDVNYILYKAIIEPETSGNYTSAPITSVIANFVNNQEEAIFLYYNGNDVETAVINEIRLVKTILKINVTPWRAPADYYVESSVNLRNLKDNL